MKCWEIIADNLKKRGWSLGWVSALDLEGRTIWIVESTNELASGKNLMRSTAWEIHPVMKLRRSETEACSGDVFPS
jgi:hypothetical protein